MAMKFEGEECRECGAEELIYWTEDETETVIEAYMNCKGCGFEFPKVIINKSEDTSEDAVKDKLRSRHL